MGAWGYDTFENDAACDWTYELDQYSDLSPVEAALEAVLNEKHEYLDIDDIGAQGLAACEVIARLQAGGGQQDAYTEAVDQWVAAHPQTPSESLIRKAEAAIDRITQEDSELFELWQESTHLESWLKAVENLRKRLRPMA
jgi:hypothetical protein